MLTYTEASKIILKSYPDFKIDMAFSNSKQYVFSISPKHLTPDDVEDSFYSINKHTGELKGYSPGLDPEFKTAIRRNVVYKSDWKPEKIKKENSK